MIRHNLQAGKTVPTRTQPCRHPDLGFPVSRTSRNTFVIYKPCGLWFCYSSLNRPRHFLKPKVLGFLAFTDTKKQGKGSASPHFPMSAIRLHSSAQGALLPFQATILCLSDSSSSSQLDLETFLKIYVMRMEAPR